MLPLGVAPGLAFSGWRRGTGITLQPPANIVFIILFVPDHPGEGLPLYQASIVVVQAGLNPGVEVIAPALAGIGKLIETVKWGRILR